MPKLKKILLIALASIVGVFAFSQAAAKRSAERQVAELRNSLAIAQGSIEIAEGVQYRLAQDIRFKERQIDEILGENSLLEEVARELEGRVFSLSQVNATLAEQIEFASNQDNSSSTTTIISETTCPEDEVPNVRVDFELESSGFRVTGFTETRPSFAELSLSQINPFVIDLALNQDGHTWSAVAAEQTGRLELEIGELVINSRRIKERWYERFGVGAAVYGSETSLALGPAISIETRRSIDLGAAIMYDFRGQAPAGQLSLTFRPFRRGR